MPEIDTPPMAPAALGRLLLAKVDDQFAQALRAAITEELAVMLKSKAPASERTVAVTVEPGRVIGHHLLWLSLAPEPGVRDEEEAESLGADPA